jgi:hypothetical protein
MSLSRTWSVIMPNLVLVLRTFSNYRGSNRKSLTLCSVHDLTNPIQSMASNGGIHRGSPPQRARLPNWCLSSSRGAGPAIHPEFQTMWCAAGARMRTRAQAHSIKQSKASCSSSGLPACPCPEPERKAAERIPFPFLASPPSDRRAPSLSPSHAFSCAA